MDAMKSVDDLMGSVVEKNGIHLFNSSSTVFDQHSDVVSLVVDNFNVWLSHLWLNDENVLSSMFSDQIVSIKLDCVNTSMTVNDFLLYMFDLYQDYMTIGKERTEDTFKVWELREI